MSWSEISAGIEILIYFAHAAFEDSLGNGVIKRKLVSVPQTCTSGTVSPSESRAAQPFRDEHGVRSRYPDFAAAKGDRPSGLRFEIGAEPKRISTVDVPVSLSLAPVFDSFIKLQLARRLLTVRGSRLAPYLLPTTSNSKKLI